MKYRYWGITFVIIGALIMLSSFMIDTGHERLIRIGGGSLFFIGTLLIPDYVVNSRSHTKDR
ncbi:hypothetical protein IHV12_07760 [Fictibacillus sp. 7GRE50]|uniref:hypothetical protein n=1 Tax=Fictibacillus TaxID=1329200 RepID=UPI0018CED52E|nr:MULTISPECIES: hypothetical protein [unclassified Fictibacillus]MBH0164809.1 hypothetical protein [Fictibacillus sp. 7GRE50]MBH0172591.1 hypothetical protein [Fictibacillus sp. 23RED33]